MTRTLKDLVLAEARAAGFDAARVTTPAAIDPRTGQRLADFLHEGRHGDMEWMATTAERRRHPVRHVARDALDRHARHELRARRPIRWPILAEPGRGAISCYAQCKDYHDVVRIGPQARRRQPCPRQRRRRQGVRRHGAADGKAAR